MPLHKEILTEEQLALLPLVAELVKDFVLVGGTAIALHLGHRRSIDFDLFSYFNYPYKIRAQMRFNRAVRLPDLLTLAAMKAFALGQRSKWKDYVDLYFIMKGGYSLDAISKKADEMFGGEFNGRIFREALAYFDDINYAEQVIFMPGFEVADATIKRELTKFSLS